MMNSHIFFTLICHLLMLSTLCIYTHVHTSTHTFFREAKVSEMSYRHHDTLLLSTSACHS